VYVFVYCTCLSEESRDVACMFLYCRCLMKKLRILRACEDGRDIACMFLYWRCPSEKTQNPVCMRVCIVRVTVKKVGMLCVYISGVIVTRLRMLCVRVCVLCHCDKTQNAVCTCVCVVGVAG